MKAIEVSNLVKYYGKFEVLKGISFQVEEGEIFGLIGPNGAGKTTTLRIISTLLQANPGTVKVFGYDVALQGDQVRKIISYLPEDAGAYKNLKGKEYLEFIARFFASKYEIKKIIERGLQIANLGERINDKVETYSKGMMRRLLIARALMIKPRLAILDEPTSGLDVINAKQVRQIIKDFVKEGGTVLLSSHNMLEVEFMCDRIALINKGQIVETGSPSALKKRYSAMNIEDVFTEVVRCSEIS